MKSYKDEYENKSLVVSLSQCYTRYVFVCTLYLYVSTKNRGLFSFPGFLFDFLDEKTSKFKIQDEIILLENQNYCKEKRTKKNVVHYNIDKYI